MTRMEVAALLSLCAAFDRRTLGEPDVEAWTAVIGDLSFAGSRDVVVEHYRGSTEWLMPATVRADVRRLRQSRLDRALDLAPDVDPADVAGYIAALRDQRRAVADGVLDPTVPELPRRRLALDGVFRSVPAS